MVAFETKKYSGIRPGLTHLTWSGQPLWIWFTFIRHGISKSRPGLCTGDPRWFVGWLLSGLLGWSTLAMASTPEPEYLTVRNGLPQGFVRSMIQDQRGFIWMATRDGLCRYDGFRFRIYTHDPQQASSLSFSSIYEIKKTTVETLWLRTENNNIDCFDPVTEHSNRISNSPAFQQALGRDQLVGIQPDQSGNVWVATQTNGFFRLNANGTVSHRHWAMQGDSVQHVLHALLLDHQSRLWLAAQDGLFNFDPASGQFVGFRQAQGLPQNEVYGLHERANGELMLGFPGRFALFQPHRWACSAGCSPAGYEPRLPSSPRMLAASTILTKTGIPIKRGWFPSYCPVIVLTPRISPQTRPFLRRIVCWLTGPMCCGLA